MSLQPEDLSCWLDSLPNHAGFTHISAQRKYAHAEDAYNTQYGVIDDCPAEGAGMCNLLARHQVDVSGPCLEIGCGTGKLTSGMALVSPWPFLLVTDPSISFLEITRKSMTSLGRDSQKLRYAVLRGDDLGGLPDGSFSVIALRSTLHHILNVEQFVADCHRSLRPGGALVMGAEPCVEGYMAMALIAKSIEPILRIEGTNLTEKHLKMIELFTSTMKFYCRQDLDKSEAEDKHLFHPFELGQTCARLGLVLSFHPNVGFSDYFNNSEPTASPDYFSRFFLSYLRYCMSFDAEFVAIIEKTMRPTLDYIQSCYSGRGNSPHLTGVFVCKKPE